MGPFAPTELSTMPPGPLVSGDLERRNRGYVVIDVGCQAIHIILEYPFRKKMRWLPGEFSEALSIQSLPFTLVLLPDIAVGANLSPCLCCRNRLGYGQGKLRTSRGDKRQKQRSLRCPTYLDKIVWCVQPSKHDRNGGSARRALSGDFLQIISFLHHVA